MATREADLERPGLVQGEETGGRVTRERSPGCPTGTREPLQPARPRRTSRAEGRGQHRPQGVTSRKSFLKRHLYLARTLGIG